MKSSLISVIKCPRCSHNEFNIKKIDENRKEIRKGKIICKNCSFKIKISDGIVDCLYNPSDEVLNEIKENKIFATKRKDKDDEWILSLPLAENFGNEKCIKVNEGYLKNVEFIIRKVNIKEKKVLELGAGTCWTTNLFAKAGADVIATDISTEKYMGLSSAEVFMKNNKIYFERVLCSMDNLPFQNNKFDIIISNAAVHHSPNIKKTFNEIRRLLKKGGLYIQATEPVCSIFNFSKKINIKKARKKGMDVSEGWNEKIYSYFDYKSLIGKKDMKSKFLFPPSFDYMLSNKENLKGVRGYKYLIGTIMNKLYSFKPFKRLFIALFPVSLILFGGSFILIAKK